ncbi:DUF3306 domain-containing protein [Roseovarius aquimarinus]|uniref:DUF3306 domain-containing protein n=1 Tax=Roseovarius aquimarinus TaxID=1229156 RepID=A0ABW7I7S7_9RHOB
MSGSDETREGGFFSGWSRRKLAAKREEARQARPPEDEAPEEAEARAALEEASREEALDEEAIAALPSLDSLKAGSDIKPFLAPGIPAKLKNAALRRMWSVTPGVRDYSDPAVDYAWDWNAPGGVPGGGGALTETGVARMVKDLIGGKPEAEAIADAPQGEAEDEETLEIAEAEPAEPPEAVRRSAPAKASEDERKTPAREVAQATQPRRHGGAVPE